MIETETIQEHYTAEAAKWGESPMSTMGDEVIRQKETEMICWFIAAVPKPTRRFVVLDVGCGNGYTLSLLASAFPEAEHYGIDPNPDLLSICDNRRVPNCHFILGTAQQLQIHTGLCDAAYTQRCLINIPNQKGQVQAIREIHRVLKPGSLYLMVECFTDGLEQNNKARRECGLPPLSPAYHNLYLDKGLLEDTEITSLFRVFKPEILFPNLPPHNFLSSHYFVARVLHALVTQGGHVRNTEFVKFFSFLPPIGNYSPLQAYILRKRDTT